MKWTIEIEIDDTVCQAEVTSTQPPKLIVATNPGRLIEKIKRFVEEELESQEINIGNV